MYPKPRATGGFPLYFSQQMDLSAGALFLSLAIGAVGAGLFLYGKKQSRPPQMIGGLLLCLYPYFVSNLWLMGGIALVIVACVWVASLRGL